MKLTYKIKHGMNFSKELQKAKKLADLAVVHKKGIRAVHYRHLGLPSQVASSTSWKYAQNKKCRNVKSVKMVVRGSILRHRDGRLLVNCLKIDVPFDKANEKINQLEVGAEYLYVCVTVPEKKEFKPLVTIGVDRNATGHIAVASCPETGKVWKFGKQAKHVRDKYKGIRKRLQSMGKFRKLRDTKRRESNILRDINHKISREIVNLATKLKGRIALENLEGIRKAKPNRTFRYTLNSWSFHQLQTFLEYKAKLAGVPIAYVDPYHTSKGCSRCGLVGIRDRKSFTCPHCGNVEHADANAGFSIALVSKGVLDFTSKEPCEKGVPIPRKRQRRQTTATLKPKVYRISLPIALEQGIITLPKNT